MRLKLTLQYSGHPYGGWQHQLPQGTPKLPSVQGTVCEALNALLTEPILAAREIVAAGRTDAGVHALMQVAHIDLPESYATRVGHSWVTGLNHYLPSSIRVIEAAVVPETFHARHSAKGRAYIYKLYTGRQMRPDLLHHAGHVTAPFGQSLDMPALQAALATLPIGIPTDFSSFRDAECQSKTPICTLTHAHIQQTEDDLWVLHIGANHFLHHMVRNIVGTLAKVALGQREPTLMPLLAAKNRCLAGTTYMPDGLYLINIAYPEPYNAPLSA